MFRSPRTSVVQPAGHASQAAQRSSTPIVSVGDVYSHAIKLLVASDKLESEDIGHQNGRRFYLIIPTILFP